MFAFFAALFGGLCLAGKSISESAKQSAADARLAKGREITNKMLDNDLEWHMRSDGYALGSEGWRLRHTGTEER